MFSNDEQPRGCAVADECLLNCQQSVNSNEEVAVVCVLKSVYVFSRLPPCLHSQIASELITFYGVFAISIRHQRNSQLHTPPYTLLANPFAAIATAAMRATQSCGSPSCVYDDVNDMWWKVKWCHTRCVCLRSEQPAFPIHMALVNECDLARAKTITRQIWYVNGFSPHKSITYPYRYAFNSAVASYNLRFRNACSIIDPSYFVSPYNMFNKRGFIAIYYIFVVRQNTLVWCSDIFQYTYRFENGRRAIC